MSRAIASLYRAAAHGQTQLWKSTLPWITPHYAVKCNDLSPLLTWLRDDGVQFDCASPGEIQAVLDIGEKAGNIIYANPCKSADAIISARKAGVCRTVVDSVEEVEKLRDCGWTGGILVRLAVPDKGSRQPFSSKFGASLSECPAIFRTLLESGLQFTGFSFHVGSECLDSQQYSSAIRMCAEAGEMAQQMYKLKVEVMDVGGGFLWEESRFRAAAAEIERGRKHYFAYSGAEWIAEPGRFFAQPAMSLEIPVIAVRRNHRGCSYTLNESIYGMFSCIPFDAQKPQFVALKNSEGPLESVTLFGNTCDSADTFGQVLLPPLRCGDILHVANIGAYSHVSSSNFNGFQKPHIKVIE